jgi:CheY-like chemotaxis protein
VVIAFFEITREVQAETARAESEASMRRAQRMESVGKLAGGIAHDFNNILGAIKAIASAMATKEDDERKRQDLQTIEGATESATQLTRALLGFAGQGKNLAAPLAFNDVVRGVTDIFDRALDRRWSIESTPGLVLRVRGDRGQLDQVVMNLLLNAREAMPNGGPITVRTRQEGSRVILEVEDAGPGVPEALRDRIFDPYFTTKDAEGHHSTGLGLSTAYGIVEAHGGTLDVLDGEKGALFRVSLPGISAESAYEDARQRGGLVKGSGLLLLVDDEPAVRVATRRALEAAGYTVLTAVDGRDAVEIFEERHAEIHAVVMDMSMPRLDGRGAYLAMREIVPGVRVLLTTGYALNDEAQSILDLGVRGFIEKPFDVYTLSREVARVLEGAK